MVGKVGESLQRIDAFRKVTGSALYSGDLSMPGMLHAQLVYADKPHAEIISIETDNAVGMDGVVAILTAEDVPNNEWGIIKLDREVLCSSRVRYQGDRIALVIAENRKQAQSAAAAVKVNYQELKTVFDPLEAMMPDAVVLHEDCPDNLIYSSQHQWGDPDKAFQKAEVIVEREYFTPMQEHAFLEPEAGLSFYDEDDILTVICGGQSVHDDQHQISNALDLPRDAVRVVYGPIGGAFGGREEISIQIILALAVHKVKRPVKMVWDRRESISGHCKRHAMNLRYKWAANSAGKIIAAHMEIIADGGAYDFGSISVMKNYLFAATGPYEIPNVRMDLKAVYTNNIPGGAFRGYGFPQITFASELQIAHLAEKLGMDPINFRLKNCYRDGSRFPTQSEVPQGVNLPELIQLSARKAGFVEEEGAWNRPSQDSGPSYIKRGIGISAGMKSSGFSLGFPESSQAKVIIYGEGEIDHVEVFTAAAEVGQGVHTALSLIAAETLEVDPEIIRMRTSDTKIIGDSGPASASRLTLYAGNAVKIASEKALSEWWNEERPAVGESLWNAPRTTDLERITGEEKSVISMMYGVHAVEVEVDIETGIITVVQVIAAHDPGRTVNRQQLIGQIEGGVVQALGWTLLENFQTKEGKILSDTLSTYLIPTVKDIPESTLSLIDELPDPVGPYGVRGIGEITFIPLAPAIIDAVHQATGVWFDSIPLVPELVREKLTEKRA